MFSYLSDAALVVFIYMSLVFVLALVLCDNSIVDIFWGLGFIVLTVFSIIRSGSPGILQILVTLMVLIWGLRLSLHIFNRNFGRGEDFRYAHWRRTWRFFILRSFLQVFMLQGFFMLVISWPVLHVLNTPSPAVHGFIHASGLLVFLAGFLFEAIGDYQLAVFRKNPDNAGKIITTGLWKLTRHPNYFGEALLWWGFWLLALPQLDGIYTVVSPLAITWLLRYVSGVPMLEKKYEGRPDWEAYKAKTPVFIPFLR